MVDTNGDPDNDEMYAHWNAIKSDATDRMDLTKALHGQSDDLTDAAKAAKLAATKAGSGHDPSSCATCQAYAGLPPA